MLQDLYMHYVPTKNFHFKSKDGLIQVPLGSPPTTEGFLHQLLSWTKPWKVPILLPGHTMAAEKALDSDLEAPDSRLSQVSEDKASNIWKHQHTGQDSEKL